MYSFPTSTTLAALTIASAASTEPISPRVSTMPSASDAIGVTHCNRIAEYHSTLDGPRSYAFRLLGIDDPRASRWLRTYATNGDTRRHSCSHADALRGGHRHADRDGVSIRGGGHCAGFQGRRHGIRALPGRRRRVDVDRRSRAPGSDDPVEAGSDDRVLPYDVRPEISLLGGDKR